MSYRDNNGNTRYSLKEKYNYHKEIANTGLKPDGTKVALNDRIRHGVLAEKNRVKLNESMKNYEYLKSINASCCDNSKNKKK